MNEKACLNFFLTLLVGRTKYPASLVNKIQKMVLGYLKICDMFVKYRVSNIKVESITLLFFKYM